MPYTSLSCRIHTRSKLPKQRIPWDEWRLAYSCGSVLHGRKRGHCCIAEVHTWECSFPAPPPPVAHEWAIPLQADFLPALQIIVAGPSPSAATPASTTGTAPPFRAPHSQPPLTLCTPQATIRRSGATERHKLQGDAALSAGLCYRLAGGGGCCECRGAHAIWRYGLAAGGGWLENERTRGAMQPHLDGMEARDACVWRLLHMSAMCFKCVRVCCVCQVAVPAATPEEYLGISACARRACDPASGHRREAIMVTPE